MKITWHYMALLASHSNEYKDDGLLKFDAAWLGRYVARCRLLCTQVAKCFDFDRVIYDKLF